MERLTVIVPVYNGEKYLEKTLESLVTQTTEDFGIIIVDDGSTDSTNEIAKKYAGEYNGITLINIPHSGVYAARNKGIEAAKGEYLLFLDCGDVITDESVEGILKCAKEDGADIITGRCWKNGDIEYEYDKALDILAVIPKVDMMESTLLKADIIGAMVFSKKLFEFYNMRFLDLSAYGEKLFIMQCVMNNVKISGCSAFILEKTVKHIEDGFSQFEMPTVENINSLKYVLSEILEMGKSQIATKTGHCDGDEAYVQEIIYIVYATYLNAFYRKYWYMSEEALKVMKEEFEHYASLINPERFKKLQEDNPDLRLPYIYTDKKEAAGEPEFSIIFDIGDENEYKPFLRSLYTGLYPFFEVIISEDKFNSSFFPEEFKNMENLMVLPEKGFHSNARRQANARVCLEIKSGAPLDERLLRDTAISKAPAMMKQYIFAQKRQTLSARKKLKDKGLNI